MYRILIVDDEPIILDWLSKLLGNLDHVELDIYKACSAKKALDLLRKIRIDIVVTDIRMPGMDGLQLMKEIKWYWPECKVIFLTGYDEFEYIYSAVHNDAVSYVLKTEDDCKVVEAVEKAIGLIEKSLKIEELVNKTKQQVNEALPFIQKEYIGRYLEGEPDSPDERRRQFEKLQIRLDPKLPVLTFIGRIDNLPGKLLPSEKSHYLYSVKNLVEQYISPYIKNQCIQSGKGDLLWLIQPDKVTDSDFPGEKATLLWEKTYNFVEGTLESVQAVSRKSLDIPVSFSLGSEPVPWEQLDQKYQSLLRLLGYYAGTGSEILITDRFYKNIKPDHGIPHHSSIVQACSKLNKITTLMYYLERGQRDEFFNLLAELTGCLRGFRSMNYNPAVEIFYSISLSILSYINRFDLTEKLALKIGLNELMHYEVHNTWDNAVDYLFQLAGALFDVQRREYNKSAMGIIDRIERYIESHLNEDISLLKLAETVYLNPSYLSRMFKQVTGRNLFDFIIDARLKKAKELLEENKLKISEIATAIGLESPSYFTRFYKKVTDMTPQEYRDSFLNR